MRTKHHNTNHGSETMKADFEPIRNENDPRITSLLEAWHENGRDFFAQSYPVSYEAGHYDTMYAKIARYRRKYVCLDCGDSGTMMVDKATGEVWGIKGYGRVHHGRFCGHVAELTTEYRKATSEARRLRRA